LLSFFVVVCDGFDQLLELVLLLQLVPLLARNIVRLGAGYWCFFCRFFIILCRNCLDIFVFFLSEFNFPQLGFIQSVSSACFVAVSVIQCS
jgi:hypothetical protein